MIVKVKATSKYRDEVKRISDTFGGRIIEMAESKTLNQMTKRFSIQSDKRINSSTIFF